MKYAYAFLSVNTTVVIIHVLMTVKILIDYTLARNTVK